jgi:polyisoprenyl-teichoic acid--peptidoglycan teichoic acid transferase
MRPTEIQPLDKKRTAGCAGGDRFTEALVWVAFLLIAAMAAIGVEIWYHPSGRVSAEVAVAPTASPLAAATSTPAHTATRVPTTAAPAAVSPTPVTPEPCVPPVDWGLHVVHVGNTLYSLARRYGTDVDTLMKVNCLNTDTIFIGQHLYVPGLGTPPTPLAMPQDPLMGTPRPTGSATPDTLFPEVRVPPTPVPTPTQQSPFRIKIPDHYLNIVLLGSDKRPNSGAWRTDSMIVVSVDTQNNVVRLLSLPRDLWVYIPGHGQNRINTADLWGELARAGSGAEKVKQTIYYNLGIPIHYYVRVDFQGFMRIIDAVGGIDVDVECPLPDINLTAGMHHMDGKNALRYARSRYSTNDFDRGRRQRKVLMALWDQGLSLDIVPKLPELWRSMSDAFQTDLSLDQVINLAYVGAQLKPNRILSRAIGPSHVQSWITPQGAAVLLPREDKIRTMLESFYATESSQVNDSDKVQVRVLNGAQRQQAEELAAAGLRWAGFKVTGTGPADRQDYAQTRIIIYTGNLAAARQVAVELAVPESAIQDVTGAPQPDGAHPVDLLIILGRDYNPCHN